MRIETPKDLIQEMNAALHERRQRINRLNERIIRIGIPVPDNRSGEGGLMQRQPNYTRIVQVLGYGGFLALWSSIYGRVPSWTFGLTVSLLVLSLPVLILSELWMAWGMHPDGEASHAHMSALGAKCGARGGRRERGRGTLMRSVASSIWLLVAISGCSNSAAPSEAAPAAPGIASATVDREQSVPPAAPSTVPDLRPSASRVEGAVEVTWPAVTGAADYAVVVFGRGAAQPVWVWQGTATTVRFGDPPDLDPELLAAARIAASVRGASTSTPPPDAEWAFMAFDAAGGIVATRPRAPL